MLIKTDIINAIKNSNIFLKVPELNGATVELRSDGQPRFFTGGFTMVFQFTKNSKKWAFRVWHTGFNQQKERFQNISKYLEKQRLRYFADFIYDEKGLLVNGELVDTIRMEWFDYDLLKGYIEKNRNDKQKLQKLADNFLVMCEDLHKHKISHGDLQHGNILVDNQGYIKLIDYDSVCVPDIEGFDELITGLKGYQHHSRLKSGNKASLKADYFSELIIYLSLCSLAENPQLWDKFNVKTTEILLFGQEDFANIQKSDIYKELSKINSDIINTLLKIYTDYLSKSSYLDLEPFYLSKEFILSKRLEKERIQIMELQQRIEIITTKNKYIIKEKDLSAERNSKLTKRMKKIKNGLTVAFILGIFMMTISIIIGYSNYNIRHQNKRLITERDNLRTQYKQLIDSTIAGLNTFKIQFNRIITERDNLRTQNKQLTTERDSLKIQKEQLMKFWRPEVTLIKVGNSRYDNTWITKPGEPLYSMRMRYFSPVITYNSIISKDIILFIKIIDPNGQLKRNEKISPKGYSYSLSARINSGSNQSLDLGGWGNSKSSSYPSGEYIVEVWYDSICLISKRIWIGP